MFSKIFPKIHAEGYKFLVIAGIITIMFYTFSNFLGFNRFSFNYLGLLFF